ncbi:hypothetical protein AGMMS49992_13200 [Clostridia bacterium]|nr:hypothetical protein AGMMS49992_13200 [Clostridia bacterium]
MNHGLYDVARQLNRLIDPAQCVETARLIWQNDRLFSFDAFDRTAYIVMDEMSRACLNDIQSLPLAADGRTRHGDWIIPQAWDARFAWLDLLTPKRVRLANYPDTPCGLVMYSAPTPPEGVTARIVRWDSPEDTGDVAGAMLFTSLPPSNAEVIKAAQIGGAVGILSDYMPLYPGVRDSREDVYDVRRWDNSFCVPRNETGLFAFSLTPRDGDMLRAMLASGESVTAHAVVDTRLNDGAARTISARAVQSTYGDSEEILGFGHQYEPGAHDNASGCAALLMAAKALRALADDGVTFRRNVRIGMGFECAGSMGYVLSNPDRLAQTKAGLVVDMVGTQGIDNAVLTVWHNPKAARTDADMAILDHAKIAQEVSGIPFPIREKAFAIGTDNILADPSLGMPTIALIAEPALSYHSSLDFIERLEPNILARNALLVALHLYYLANADDAALTPCIPDAASFTAIEDARVPVRTQTGCLTRDLPGWSLAWNTRLHIPLFWMDGSRSWGEILERSRTELGVDDVNAEEYFTEMNRFIDALVLEGIVRWR